MAHRSGPSFGTTSSVSLLLLLAALAVHFVSQLLAGLELRNLLRGDLDLLAVAGVAAGAGSTGGDGEGAEADEGDLVAGAEGARDAADDLVQGGSGLGLVDVRLLGDGGDQLGLVHENLHKWG